jgi:hypothetical protein
MGVLAVALSAILVGGVLPAAVVAGGAVARVPAQATLGPACAGWGNTAVAVGSPRRSVDGVPQAGVVELHYRSGSQWEVTTLTSSMLGLPLEANGWFGASVALFGDVQSGCRDLVIGMPGANQGRGAVALLPDLGSGLVPSGAVLLPTESVSLQPGDRLGTSLATLGWCCEAGMGWQRIAAGAPGRDAPGAPDAGAVFSWRILDPATVRVESPTSLTFEPPDTYVQGSGGVQGRAERNDRFGSVLSEVESVYGGFAVGIPDEDIGARKDAGAVAFLRFSTTGVLEGNDLLWQGSGLPGKSRAGDRAGAAVLNRHVGVPGQDADGRKDSGAVLMWDNESNHYRVVTQNSKGVPDTSEKGDAFGSALAGNLLVGVPGEDVKGRKDVGAVTLLPGHLFLTEGKAVRQRAPGGLAAGDRFGAALLYQDYSCGEDVYCSVTLIGAPGDDRRGARNAGAYYSVKREEMRVGVPALFARGISPGERFGGFVMNTLLPM